MDKRFAEMGGELKRNKRGGEHIVSSDGVILAKKCTTCGEWKENNTHEFSKHPTSPGGTAARCRICKRTAERAQYISNGRQKMKNYKRKQPKSEVLADGSVLKENQKGTAYIEVDGKISSKVCIKCKEMKGMQHYTKKHNGFAGVNPACTECRRMERVK